MSKPSPDQPETIHELKTWPDYFVHLLDGSKTFEYRRNDRGFKVGDVLHLREWEPLAWESGAPTNGRYTGRQLRCRVTYVLATSPEFVIMALASSAPAPVPDHEREMRESLTGLDAIVEAIRNHTPIRLSPEMEQIVRDLTPEAPAPVLRCPVHSGSASYCASVGCTHAIAALKEAPAPVVKYRDRLFTAAFAYKEDRITCKDLMEVIDPVVEELRERADEAQSVVAVVRALVEKIRGRAAHHRQRATEFPGEAKWHGARADAYDIDADELEEAIASSGTEPPASPIGEKVEKFYQSARKLERLSVGASAPSAPPQEPTPTPETTELE